MVCVWWWSGSKVGVAWWWRDLGGKAKEYALINVNGLPFLPLPLAPKGILTSCIPKQRTISSKRGLVVHDETSVAVAPFLSLMKHNHHQPNPISHHTTQQQNNILTPPRATQKTTPNPKPSRQAPPGWQNSVDLVLGGQLGGNGNG